MHLDDFGPWWVEFEAIPEYVAGLSAGEQRFLNIVSSIGDGVSAILGEVMPGLDRDHLCLVLAALAHAAGSHQHSDVTTHDDGNVSFKRFDSLYPGPQDPCHTEPQGRRHHGFSPVPVFRRVAHGFGRDGRTVRVPVKEAWEVNMSVSAPADPLHCSGQEQVRHGRDRFAVLPPGGRWLVRSGLPVGLLGMIFSIAGTAASVSDGATGSPPLTGALLISFSLILTGFGYYRQAAAD